MTLRTILSAPGIHQSAIQTGGSLVAMVFSAVGLIIISRLLGPINYAEFGAAFALIMVLSRLFGMGVFAAVQKVAGEHYRHADSLLRVREITQTASQWLLGSSFLLLATGMITSVFFTRILGFHSPWLVWWCFIFAMGTMYFEFVVGVFQSLHIFTAAAGMMLTQASWKLAVALIAVGLWSLGPIGTVILFTWFYVAPWLAVIVFAYALPSFGRIEGWRMLLPLSHSHLRDQLREVTKHIGVFVAITGIIEYIDILFVQRFTTAHQTGIYSGINQLSSALVIGALSIGVVLNTRVARYHSRSDIQSYLRKTIVIPIGALAGAIISWPLSALAIHLSIGSAYAEGSMYLPWLLFTGWLTLATVPYHALFYSFKDSRYFSWVGIGQAIITIGGDLLLIPNYGLAGATSIRVLSKIFFLVFTLGYAVMEYRKVYSK